MIYKVKSEKQNIDLRKLFREKLENAEVIPEASVSSNLMRKVARREFLQFNPARLNVYYILGMLTVGLVTALVLSSGPTKNDDNKLQIPSKNIKKSVDTNKLYIPVEPPSKKNTEIPDTIPLKQNPDKPAVGLIMKSHDQTTKKTLSKNHDEIKRPYVGDFFSGKRLFTAEDTEMNKLQGSILKVTDLINASVTEGCPPLRVRFTNKLSSYDSCRWSFGDGGNSNAKNPEWIFDVEGEYKVSLTVFKSNGSLITSSDIITVHPKPAARFEISDADSEHPGKNHQIYKLFIKCCKI